MTIEVDFDEQDSDYDGAWKEALQTFFAVILECYFPLTFAEIDWSVDPVWLDKEISQIIGQRNQRNRVVDLLVQVRLKNGCDQWILLHVEIQSRYDPEHASRLALYHAGIMSTFRQPVVTLSILADLNANWMPCEHEFCFGGFRVRWEFPTCKLVQHLETDWSDDRRLPVLLARAQIAALRTANDPTGRFDAKWQLIRNLYDAGLTADEIRPWFRMIDWMMRLTRELEQQFNQKVIEFEKEHAVKFIPSHERKSHEEGIKEGVKAGIQEGTADAVIRVLKRRCGPTPPDFRERLMLMPRESMLELLDLSFEMTSWFEAEAWVDSRSVVDA